MKLSGNPSMEELVKSGALGSQFKEVTPRDTREFWIIEKMGIRRIDKQWNARAGSFYYCPIWLVNGCSIFLDERNSADIGVL